jgi:peptidoglycan/LPS O-acetylase OafA/YrhL
LVRLRRLVPPPWMFFVLSCPWLLLLLGTGIQWKTIVYIEALGQLHRLVRLRRLLPPPWMFFVLSWPWLLLLLGTGIQWKTIVYIEALG